LGEVGKDAVLYTDPFDVEEIAQKVLQLIQNEELRKEKIAQGLKRVKLFLWRKAAEEIYHVLDSLK
jgi:glycosyltransferase involved in cell wall biosynthesis